MATRTPAQIELDMARLYLEQARLTTRREFGFWNLNVAAARRHRYIAFKAIERAAPAQADLFGGNA
jgi:hypothetical protein